MFKGSLVALVTPMTQAGEIDFAAWRGLVQWHLDAGTSGIVVGGTTGESACLAGAELVRLIEEAGAVLAGKCPIIAGTGMNDTRKAAALTARACAAGADACLVVTPYYNKPEQEGMYQHFMAVADAANRPILLYNVPSRTGCDMQPETVARLARHPRVAGIKEAVADIARGRQILECCGDDFVLLSGDDPTALELMKAGARGVISVTANVAPEAMAKMCQCVLRDDWEAAEAIDGTLSTLHKRLFLEANPIPAKWALSYLGRIQNALRLPMTCMDPKHAPALLQAMTRAGVSH